MSCRRRHVRSLGDDGLVTSPPNQAEQKDHGKVDEKKDQDEANGDDALKELSGEAFLFGPPKNPRERDPYAHHDLSRKDVVALIDRRQPSELTAAFEMAAREVLQMLR